MDDPSPTVSNTKTPPPDASQDSCESESAGDADDAYGKTCAMLSEQLVSSEHFARIQEKLRANPDGLRLEALKQGFPAAFEDIGDWKFEEDLNGSADFPDDDDEWMCRVLCGCPGFSSTDADGCIIKSSQSLQPDAQPDTVPAAGVSAKGTGVSALIQSVADQLQKLPLYTNALVKLSQHQNGMAFDTFLRENEELSSEMEDIKFDIELASDIETDDDNESSGGDSGDDSGWKAQVFRACSDLQSTIDDKGSLVFAVTDGAAAVAVAAAPNANDAKDDTMDAEEQPLSPILLNDDDVDVYNNIYGDIDDFVGHGNKDHGKEVPPRKQARSNHREARPDRGRDSRRQQHKRDKRRPHQHQQQERHEEQRQEQGSRTYSERQYQWLMEQLQQAEVENTMLKSANREQQTKLHAMNRYKEQSINLKDKIRCMGKELRDLKSLITSNDIEQRPSSSPLASPLTKINISELQDTLAESQADLKKEQALNRQLKQSMQEKQTNLEDTTERLTDTRKQLRVLKALHKKLLASNGRSNAAAAQSPASRSPSLSRRRIGGGITIRALAGEPHVPSPKGKYREMKDENTTLKRMVDDLYTQLEKEQSEKKKAARIAIKEKGMRTLVEKSLAGLKKTTGMQEIIEID